MAVVVVVVDVVVIVDVVVVMVVVVTLAPEVRNSAGQPTIETFGKMPTQDKPALLEQTNNFRCGYQCAKMDTFTVRSELSDAKICITERKRQYWVN